MANSQWAHIRFVRLTSVREVERFVRLIKEAHQRCQQTSSCGLSLHGGSDICLKRNYSELQSLRFRRSLA